MPSTLPPCAAAVSSEIAVAQRAEKKKGRGTAWVFIEMLCAFLAVSGVNMKLCDGRVKRERLAHQNDAFKYQIKSMWDAKKWVDQHGATEDKKTPDMCIQERVSDIKTDADSTAISGMADAIMKLARNVFLPHLRTLLDSNGHIRSGQVKENVIEALRLHYFEYKKTRRAGKAPPLFDGDAAEQAVENVNPADALKLQAAKDRFHPPEFYVFLHQGPLVIGGQNNVCLLQDPAAMQKALGVGGGPRQKHREQASADIEEEARSKKKRAVTSTLSSALLLASPTGSLASSVPSSASTFGLCALARERLEIERRRCATDRLMGRMAAAEQLMEYATTPEEKAVLVDKHRALVALLRKMVDLEDEDDLKEGAPGEPLHIAVPRWLQVVMKAEEVRALQGVMQREHVEEADLEFFTEEALKEAGVDKAITRAKVLRCIREHFRGPAGSAAAGGKE